MDDDFDVEIMEAEVTVAALAVAMWPVASIVDIVTGVSVVSPMAAIGIFAFVGGSDVLSNFGNFTKAYAAAGVTFAAMTYTERKLIEAKLAEEETKIEGFLEAKTTAYGQKWAGKSLKDWCAVKQKGPGLLIQNMVCSLDLTSLGIKK